TMGVAAPLDRAEAQLRVADSADLRSGIGRRGLRTGPVGGAQRRPDLRPPKPQGFGGRTLRRRARIGVVPLIVDRRDRSDVTIINIENPPEREVETPPPPRFTPAEPLRLRPGTRPPTQRAEIRLEASGNSVETTARSLREKRAVLDRAIQLAALDTCAIGEPRLAIRRSETAPAPALGLFEGVTAFSLGVQEGEALVAIVAALDPETVASLAIEPLEQVDGEAEADGNSRRRLTPPNPGVTPCP
ncbi:MAG: hypothetical protein AAFZ09_12285, partial [Pseudomonadota bacterium]